MESDFFTFADNTRGLAHAWNTAVFLRRAGHRTRLALRRIGNTFVHTVVSEPPSRPNREARGCNYPRAFAEKRIIP